MVTRIIPMFFMLLGLTIAAEELPRRVTVGIAAVPATPDTLAIFSASHGLIVQKVTAGFPGDDAGIREGDLLLSIGGTRLDDPAKFVASVRGARAGESLPVEIATRDGDEVSRRTVSIHFEEHPRETGDDYELIYGYAEAGGNRYRTIATRPKGTGPYPGVFIVQGLGCFSIDDPGGRFSYHLFVSALTNAGFATLRVDKPGTGDSEGGPCPAVDFHTEVRAYQAGLVWFVERPWVDGDRMALFGHSMGGIMAPMIAEAAPIQRAVTYGSGFNSWYFYMLENTRRQMRLGGVPFEKIAEREKSFEKLNSIIFIEGRSLGEALDEVPAWKDEFPDRRSYAAGKSYEYFQQIYAINFAEEWKESGMEVLAVWGTSDFVATETEQEWLAAAVSSWIPEGGTFLRMEKTDHWFNHAESFRHSMMQGPINGEFNEEIIDVVLDYVQPLRN